MKGKKGVAKTSATIKDPFLNIDKNINNLSEHEMKELLLINMYKMALMRAQLEALTNIMIKNKFATFEDIWKETNENFKNTI
jgi:hypothetical protein